jgi:hypothetical protein
VLVSDSPEELDRRILAEPENLELHDMRYHLALASGDEDVLRAALADSSITLEDEGYVMLLASLEESLDRFEEALAWRRLALRLRDSPENRTLVERCEESVLFARARKILETHRLLYRHEPEIMTCLELLQELLSQRDKPAVEGLLERILQIRRSRRGPH